MDRFLAAVQGFVRWNWTARWTWHLPRCRAAARFFWLGAVGEQEGSRGTSTASVPPKSLQPTASSQSDSFRTFSTLGGTCRTLANVRHVGGANVQHVGGHVQHVGGHVRNVGQRIARWGARIAQMS